MSHVRGKFPPVVYSGSEWLIFDIHKHLMSLNDFRAAIAILGRCLVHIRAKFPAIKDVVFNYSVQLIDSIFREFNDIHLAFSIERFAF